MAAEKGADVELEKALETGSFLLGVESDQERTGWWRGCCRVAPREKRIVQNKPKNKQTNKKRVVGLGQCLCIIDLNKHSGWGWLVSEGLMAGCKRSYMGQ